MWNFESYIQWKANTVINGKENDKELPIDSPIFKLSKNEVLI
jgi:hypothetical protein